MLFRGIVNDNVESPEFFDSSLHCGDAKTFTPYVAGNQQTTTPFIFDKARCFLRIDRLVQINDGHVRAFRGERHRHGATDPAVAARNKRDAIVQFCRETASHLRLRPRHHLRFEAGLTSLVLCWAEWFLFALQLRHMPFSSGVREVRAFWPFIFRVLG
jgi:hypothetical protein